ncbi:response regulator transcription factor [Candidatus Puniceispirillum sp.]|nr:response regulator transcription factor [Candidatus Puniceispirillum sp.]
MILSSRILIVEDNALFRSILSQQLALEGFKNVIEIGLLANFDDIFRDANPDLVLLSNQMPDGNSFDICRKLRINGFFKSIIMLIPKGADDAIALGLEAGANNYITKPLRMAELMVLIRSQLFQVGTFDDMQFEIGNLSFEPANKMLFDIGSDSMQTLTEKEATILKFLYQAFPSDMSKAQILAKVWGFQNTVSTHTLETHIYRLRQKIRHLTDKQLVMTTENGYRLAD